MVYGQTVKTIHIGLPITMLSGTDARQQIDWDYYAHTITVNYSSYRRNKPVGLMITICNVMVVYVLSIYSDCSFPPIRSKDK